MSVTADGYQQMSGAEPFGRVNLSGVVGGDIIEFAVWAFVHSLTPPPEDFTLWEASMFGIPLWKVNAPGVVEWQPLEVPGSFHNGMVRALALTDFYTVEWHFARRAFTGDSADIGMMIRSIPTGATVGIPLLAVARWHEPNLIKGGSAEHFGFGEPVSPGQQRNYHELGSGSGEQGLWFQTTVPTLGVFQRYGWTANAGGILRGDYYPPSNPADPVHSISGTLAGHNVYQDWRFDYPGFNGIDYFTTAPGVPTTPADDNAISEYAGAVMWWPGRLRGWGIRHWATWAREPAQ